jgi:hypothetical protein
LKARKPLIPVANAEECPKIAVFHSIFTHYCFDNGITRTGADGGDLFSTHIPRQIVEIDHASPFGLV